MYDRELKRLPSDKFVRCRPVIRWTTRRCVNLSVKGCMVDAMRLDLEENDHVTVELLENVRIEARVVWSRENHFGLEFLEEVDPNVVEQLAWAGSLAGSEDGEPGVARVRPIVVPLAANG